MSDSEDELLSIPFHYQNDMMVINANGPNINTGMMSFRNNFSSTRQLPRTFEPRYTESCFDSQSRYSRREPSPMSVASACDARYRNFHFNNSQYRGMSSQRSMYNGRSGSPMSIRTFDSSVTMSATDITMALKHSQYNNHDLRKIKEVLYSLMKKNSRKSIEKRRKLKLIMKGRRRRSGYDSGEQASDSSLSSDHGRSIRTGFEENMSSCRSTKTDLVSQIRNTIKDSNIYKDCTDNIRQNSFRKLVNEPANLNNSRTSTSSLRNPVHSFHNPRLKGSSSTQSLSSFQTQKERFQNGFVLPSQRFKKSVLPPSIPENPNTRNDDTDSDYDLFSTNTNKETNDDNRKRSINEEDQVPQNNKRPKVLSPCKNSAEVNKATKELANNNINEKSNDFEFAKPMMPVRKFKEKLISTSGPLTEIVIGPPQSQQTSKTRISKEAGLDNETTEMTDITQNSDVSMRPSFIKRKLFTQKLDVIENKNLSTDNINSPQNSMYSTIQKEKHKARKLVTNQSCLSRDIEQDDSNLLELIHKIVPANSIKVTTQSNVNKTNTNNNKSIDSDKFDVTSIITTKNGDDDISDTFTDEEIFNGDKNNIIKDKSKEKPKQNSAKKTKVNEKTVEKSKINVNPVIKTPAKEKVKESVGNFTANNCRVALVQMSNKDVNAKTKCWSTFWDLDSESDIESVNPKRNELKDRSNDSINNTVQCTSIATGLGTIFKTPSVLNAPTMSAMDTTQRLNITGFKIRSHRLPKMKKCEEAKGNTIKSYFEISRKLNDTSILNDNKISEENLVQKTNVPSNIITQKDSKTNNTKKAKIIPQKGKPKKKCKVNEENVSLLEKKKKQNTQKTKTTPAKKGRPPKSETLKEAVSEQNTPVKVQDKTKDKKTSKSEGKLPNNGQIKTLKDTTQENQEPNKKQSDTPKKQDNKNNTKQNQEPNKKQSNAPKKRNNIKNNTKENQEPNKKSNTPKKQANIQNNMKQNQEPNKKQSKTLKKQANVKNNMKDNQESNEKQSSNSKQQDNIKNKVKTNTKGNQEPNRKQNNTPDKQVNIKSSVQNKTKESQEPNKKQSNNTKPPKKQDNNKNTQKILLQSSLTNSSVENDNSKIYRAIRSCRVSKNSTINSSKDSYNLSMTLRPRNHDLTKSRHK